jgi:hypothetical protein
MAFTPNELRAAEAPWTQGWIQFETGGWAHHAIPYRTRVPEYNYSLVLPLNYRSATTQLPLSYHSATTQLPLNYRSTTAQLPLSGTETCSTVQLSGIDPPPSTPQASTTWRMTPTTKGYATPCST